MTTSNNKMEIAETQPLSALLKPVLPVNYFLFVKDINDRKEHPVVNNVFYNTEAYALFPFYKSISNIL
jgi:hypothetical protein